MADRSHDGSLAASGGSSSPFIHICDEPPPFRRKPARVSRPARGQSAQVLQLLVECPCERVYRDVVRTGPVVFPDALGERLRLAPWDDGVDEGVAAAAFEVGVGEPQFAQVVQVAGHGEGEYRGLTGGG